MEHSEFKKKGIFARSLERICKRIFISLKDYEANKGKEVRLMNLFNINVEKGEKAEFASLHSKDNDKNLNKINWVSEFVNARVLMPEGKWIGGIAEESVKNLKEGQIIQFERFGFVRFDRINSAGEYEFWFAHR